MAGYAGMVLVGGILVAIALLRWMYGKPSAIKSWYEELVTYGALLLFIVAFSLTVARSPEGIERFRQDISQAVSYTAIHAPLSREAIVLQLSSSPVDKKKNRTNCSTCHVPKRELIPQLAKTVQTDGDRLQKEFEEVLKPLRQTLSTNREVVRHLPKAEPVRGFWLKLGSWFTAEGRRKRKTQQQAQVRENESAIVDARIKQVEAYYKVEKFKAQKAEYTCRPGNSGIPTSVYYLLLAAENNNSFYKALCKGNEDRIKAAWSLKMLDWGMSLFVVVVLWGRLFLRNRYPETEWYILPGMVLLAGISLQLMTDLSLNYIPKLRFIALYHWRNTLSGMFFIFAAIPVLGTATVHRLITAVLGKCRLHALKAALVVSLIALVVAVGGYFMPTDRYKASETLKVLLVTFLAWFAVARGEYICRKTALNGLKGEWWVTDNLLELLMISLAVALAFVSMHDLGPLLVSLLFLSAYTYLLMGGRMLLTLLSVWGALTTLALGFRWVFSRLGGLGYLYRRLDEMIMPFLHGSGEIARLKWLRRSAGLSGHDFGELPYYGHYIQKVGSTTVVTPAQIQSDYTVTHIFAIWGYLPGSLLFILYMVWLIAVYILGARSASSSVGSQSSRFMGWWIALSALMLILQALITFAGNFAIAPLSGLTMPMVSYGSATMLFSCILISLVYAKEKLL